MNKNDLQQIDELLQKRLYTMKKELLDRMDELEVSIIALVDKHKADKTQVNNLEQRVVKLENPYG